MIEDASPDVAERFLLHDLVGRAKDAESYVANQDALALEPLSQPDLDQLRAAKDGLKKRFGSEFLKPYGWAAPLFPSATATAGVIERVGLSSFWIVPTP